MRPCASTGDTPITLNSTLSAEAPSLGDLDDSSKYTAPVDISGTEVEWLERALEDMLLIRACEERLADMVTAGQIVCPAHLAIGQEAVAVGVAAHLRPTDRAFGTHRSHSHYLAMGGDLNELFAEVLGKEAGCSKGMGGSMHLYARHRGFAGSVPIVGATISLATGAALAAKLDKRSSSDLGIAFFGDGATEEGTFHESMNLAARYALPMLFVCENNLFASHLHVSLRQPSSCMARFAAANCMPFEIVDGNDIVAVARATKRLADGARSGNGPGFLEAVTYRWRGHVGPRDDLDVGVARSKTVVDGWKMRDPIRRLREAILSAGVTSKTRLGAIAQRVADRVTAAAAAADEAPYPPLDRLMGLVYPPHTPQ